MARSPSMPAPSRPQVPAMSADYTVTTHQLSENGFDRIVAGLYDASTGGRDWSDALEPIQQVFGARAVVLHTADIVDTRLLSLQVGGPDMSRSAYDYITGWERHDTRKHRILKLGTASFGQWLHCHDYVDETFRQRNAYHRHFLTGHEVRYNSSLIIPRDERTITGFAFELHASRGPLDDDERELARRLGQHLQQALQGHERMQALAAQTLIGHQLLQAFAFPMWLLDEDRGVLFGNAAAQAVEQAGQPVQRLQGRLRMADSGDDRKLAAHLHTLGASTHGSRAALRLGRRADLAEHTAWLHLCALDPQQVMGLAFGPRRCVLATLFRPTQVSALDPFALAQTFELTPTEARVAALLAEGLELAAIGERLNVRVTTVRTHVRSVLEALGQKRMTDVVRLLRDGQMLWAARP